MLETFNQTISTVVSDAPLVAYLAAFAGGILSSASPCVLAMVPLVIGYVGGYTGGDPKHALIYSASFVLGLSVTFTLLGVAASFVGGLLGGIGDTLYLVLAGVLILMGLSLIGLFEIPWPSGSGYRPKAAGAAGAAGAFVMGLFFGVASSPCATPVLVAILAYVGAEGRVVYGGSLLFAYALGHCVLIFVAGASVGLANRFVNSKGMARASVVFKRLSGAALVGVGVYVAVTNIF
jgi:cytochrome c biogenesis protein CcdA